MKLVQVTRQRKQMFAVDSSPTDFKAPLYSALILSVANMGDAFLYAYLPAHFQQIGLSSFWVGIILAINRFTRLFLNGRVAWFLNNKSIKTVMIIAILAASLATVSYGWVQAIPLWIFARILWGLSFSTLRLGNTLYALHHPRKGMALGMSRALIELGPLIALLAGPYLLQTYGRCQTFMMFGLISLTAMLLVLPLNHIKTDRVSRKDLLISFPSAFNILVLVSAFITEGVLVVLLTRFIPGNTTCKLLSQVAMVGLILGYRRISMVLFAPLSGWLADKKGFQAVFIYTTVLSIAALLLVFSGAIIPGILAIFTFSAMNTSVATGGGINPGKALIKSISDNATWRDIGTAFGAFTGALLLPVFNFLPVMASLLLLYICGFIYYLVKLNTETDKVASFKQVSCHTSKDLNKITWKQTVLKSLKKLRLLQH